MSQNELDEVHNVFYYPLLRFYPRDSKHRPYDYDLGLSLDELLSFVKRVASVPINTKQITQEKTNEESK